MNPRYIPRQGQFLSFLYYYTKINGMPPSEADIARYFNVTPLSAHQMVLTLEKRELIQRTPGRARTIRLLLPRDELPDLD